MKLKVEVKDNSVRAVLFSQVPILASVQDRSLSCVVKQKPNLILTTRVVQSPITVKVVAEGV